MVVIWLFHSWLSLVVSLVVVSGMFVSLVVVVVVIFVIVAIVAILLLLLLSLLFHM